VGDANLAHRPNHLARPVRPSAPVEGVHRRQPDPRTNGVSETELEEVIIHRAFYAGWPGALSAVNVAQVVCTG
jgi:hypothetical protein